MSKVKGTRQRNGHASNSQPSATGAHPSVEEVISTIAGLNAFDTEAFGIAFLELLYQLAAIEDKNERVDFVWNISELVYNHTPQYVSSFQAFDSSIPSAPRAGA